MERNEPALPALVPEWLRTSSGSGTGTIGSNNQFASPFAHSDDRAVSKHTRNKPSHSINDREIGRSGFSDRSTSSYFRQNTSGNGSSHLWSHSSFSKKDTSDKDRSVFGDQHRDYVDPLGSISGSRSANEILQRSQSTLIGRRGDSWPKKVASDSKHGNKTNYRNDDSLVAGVRVGSNGPKYAFERDFPSLGTEERQNGSETGRAPSSGLHSIAIRNLPVGSSAVIGSDGWTSALVQVPGSIGSNSTNVVLPQQSVSVSPHSTPPSSTTSLNMAETVSQGPSRARAPPQLSVETQRLEELVMKQSRQLIPMTPSTTKISVLSPSDKGKPKIRQQLSSHPVSLTSRGGPASLGKLHVLKPSRELNGVSSVAKDSSSPGSKIMNSPSNASLSTAGSVPLRTSSNTPNFTTFESKSSPKSVEKKPSAQARSRNDFFNRIKNKSSGNSPVPCSDPVMSPSTLEKPDEAITKTHTLLGGDTTSLDTSMPDLSTDSKCEECDSPSLDTSQTPICNGEKKSSPDAILHPDEEEAAFLRSLGWEESAGEDEGLTEEEINAFYKEYLDLRPSLKLQGLMPKLFDPLNSQNGNCCSASSESSSSYSESES